MWGWARAIDALLKTELDADGFFIPKTYAEVSQGSVIIPAWYEMQALYIYTL